MKLNHLNKNILTYSSLCISFLWSLIWPILFLTFISNVLSDGNILNDNSFLVETIIGFIGINVFQTLSLSISYLMFSKTKNKKYFVLSIFLIPSLFTFIFFINAIANLILIIFVLKDRKKINNELVFLETKRYYSFSILRSIYFFCYYISLLTIFLYKLNVDKEIYDGSMYWINGLGLGMLIKLSVDQIIDSKRIVKVKNLLLWLNYFVVISGLFFILIFEKKRWMSKLNT